MMKSSILFISALSLFQLAFSQAPKLRFEHYGVDEGLPNMSVQDIYQDRYGFLWVGTWDGLAFFDGKNFSTYQRIPFDSSSISDNDIQSITEDQKGNLWLATKNGINRFNRNQHTFTRFFLFFDPRGVPRNMGQIAYTDPEGKTWISFMNSNIILSYDHTCQGFEGQRARGSIYSMNSWKNYLLLGTRDDVAFFDKTANSIVQSDSIIPGISRLNGLYVIDILVSKSGAIWFATLRGLFRYDPFSQDWLYYFN